MKVQAAKGIQCPMEGKPRKYITDDKPVEVKATPYYLRLVRDGSLVDMDQVDVKALKEEPKKTKGK